ncbi:MAG: DUF499 domain-containing protein [Acidobacteriota bacterium]
MEPWYKVVTPRKEVREGRSFNPDEFAIHLEQVVAGTAPADYRDPAKFFSRTCFTRALTEHTGMVLRRLAGETANTAPVLTLVTQFGGGKTHTLTVLLHLARAGQGAAGLPGVNGLLSASGLGTVPGAKVAAFVGNAWDPQPGRETPWIDVARQLAGAAGVALLGPAAASTPPGTETLAKVFAAADGPVLVLFDEVLNFVNRHRGFAESFHAFIQNLTVAMTGQTRSAAVISLPRSQTEMTDWDMQWQEKITRVVRRVAKDLIVNDEGEIAEVIRRRLFEDLGPDQEKQRRKVAKTYAAWCFERRAQLPPEWTAVDTASTEAKALDFLQGRFEACYPFHPATISVFQRKWQTVSQYQQTRGTLAMLAQWVSRAMIGGITKARTEPLITLGWAPLDAGEFRSVVLGQLGEARLGAAIDADIAGGQAHAAALDADAGGPLADIHRRVGAAIFFESSGGQVDKVAHLPELRFAIGGPDVDTATVDNAAHALETRTFYIRRVGSDGFRISYKPTLKKVVNDRRASLDEEKQVVPAMRSLVKDEVEKGRTVPLVAFPADGAEIADSPKLTLVVAAPDLEWPGDSALRERIGEWTRKRGAADRLYPGALVWCFKKPGRELHDRVVDLLAWRRVRKDVDEGVIGGEFEKADLDDLRVKARVAEDDARDEVWASYRYLVVADPQGAGGLREIDLGAGHASSGETLCGRVIAALKNESLLNESIGAGYLDRNWPPALKTDGAWPLTSLRQSFLNGALTRLIDADGVLRSKLVEFVTRGDFGLASGYQPNGRHDRLWFAEPVPADEVAFEPGVFLLTKQRAKALRSTGTGGATPTPPKPEPEPPIPPAVAPATPVSPTAEGRSVLLRLSGPVPLEAWNRVGTKLIPKLRSGKEAGARVEFVVTADGTAAPHLRRDLQQILEDLNLASDWTLEE